MITWWDGKSFERIRHYIKWNPFKAGWRNAGGVCVVERDAARKGGGTIENPVVSRRSSCF